MKTAEYSFKMLEPFDEKRNVSGTSVWKKNPIVAHS